MMGRKLLFALSLLPLAMSPMGAMAADVKAQSSARHLWYYDPFQSRSDPGNTVVFSGNQADIFR
jgi:hypothetical protein